ncbi:hypothetical protein K450DRAFT_248809 [Umbelopsis ramanniana AG]|uniref:F-box domain-containing protein n=1 Tax=Umbelopsis ramanniana AG TaxID=1314678 RepID=A0AAD5HBI7_UMBRA|nr:uncharacterized protein K450DRAFT_248809 [Umbelopsis ramanniana AG]KAI8578057.1 hypothetical protein K450DRAFT_248809 [Umbelopsis ramanniana AG]
MAFRSTTILDLNLDILRQIIRMCDKFTLASLAQTCRPFASLIHKTISFENAAWYNVNFNYDHAPPVFNPRGGVLIGRKFYLPFMAAEPNCFELDIKNWIWKRHSISIQGNAEIKAFVTTAVAIGPLIYMFGGREVQSFTLSNTLYVLDTRNFQLKLIDDASGTPPRPRHEHSVDVIYDRYVAIFGGLCYHSVGENDMFLYDTVQNEWLEPHVIGRTPHIRFGHASTVIDNCIYVFGGCQIENECNRIYDDLYKFDFNKSTWYKFEHPEMFDARRHASRQRYGTDEAMDVDPGSPISTSPSMDTDYLISTTGSYPRDRFQCAMIALGNKLVIFGGHTLRQDDDDNNELFDYSINQVDIFDPEWNHWTSLDATSEAGPVYPADMSYGLYPTEIAPNGSASKVFVVGQQKLFDTPNGQVDFLSSGSNVSIPEQLDTPSAESYFSVPVNPLNNMHTSGTLATPQALMNVDGQAEQLPILSEPGRLVRSPGNLKPEERLGAPHIQQKLNEKDPHVKRSNPPIDMSPTNKNDKINPSRRLRPQDEGEQDTEVHPHQDPLSKQVKEIFKQEVDLAHQDSDHLQGNTDKHQLELPSAAESVPASSSLHIPSASGRRDADEHHNSSDEHRASSGSGHSHRTGSGGLALTSGDSTASDGWYGKDTRKYSLESFCMLLLLNT